MVEVKISPDECRQVERLFVTLHGYQNILSYLINNSENNLNDNPTFSQKWAEAIELDYQLENLKKELDKKYRPKNSSFSYYEFDFNNNVITYYNIGEKNASSSRTLME